MERDQLVCPFHGLRFDSTGVCKWVPETERDAPGICVETYPSQEKHGWIWIHWRAGERSEAHLPWFESLPDPLYVNRLAQNWPVHFSRSVENQLDYAHLPFVHKTTIGRFSRQLKPPQFQISPDRLKWYFGSPDQTHIEFVYPNLWLNRISSAYALTLAFAPIDDQNTRLYLRSYRRHLTWPPISWIVNWLERALNRWILAQDQRVVIAQEPGDSRAAQEVLLGSDRFIRHFREWMNQK